MGRKVQNKSSSKMKFSELAEQWLLSGFIAGSKESTLAH